METTWVYVIVFVLMIARINKERTLKPSRMWITPVLFIWLAYSSISHTVKVTTTGIILYIVCLIIGLAIGVLRANMDTIRYYASTDTLTTQSSVGSTVVFMATVLLRILVGYWGASHALLSLSNALIMVSLGSVCARRYMVYTKYRQLKGSWNR